MQAIPPAVEKVFEDYFPPIDFPFRHQPDIALTQKIADRLMTHAWELESKLVNKVKSENDFMVRAINKEVEYLKGVINGLVIGKEAADA